MSDESKDWGAPPPRAGSASRVIRLGESASGKRLDLVLAALFPEFSRSALVKRVKAGGALLDGSPAKPSTIVKSGQTLAFAPPPERVRGLRPAPQIALKILHEDGDILVTDKPAGLAVHPGAGTDGPTLIEALLALRPELGLMEETHRCGLVHRLDKDTSGVLVTARNAETQEFLSAQFKERAVKKKYLAFVRGAPEKTRTIDSPIGRHPSRRHKMAAGLSGGRPSRTSYRVLRRFPKTGLSLISISLFTGRTHQARAHLASVGLPVLGDLVYGGGSQSLFKAFPGLKKLVKRQFLHARRISVPRPDGGGRLAASSPWPLDFRELFRELLILEGE